jgi:hypothetical protein
VNGALQLRRIVTALAAGVAAQAALVHLFRRGRRRHARERRHILVTQGGQRLRLATEEVSDLVVSVLMGGAIVDLRGARCHEEPGRIEVLAIMGGVQIIVPNDWRVRVEIETTMAGVQDRRVGGMDANRPCDLLVSGRVALGGLEIVCEDAPGTLPGSSYAPGRTRLPGTRRRMKK